MALATQPVISSPKLIKELAVHSGLVHQYKGPAGQALRKLIRCPKARTYLHFPRDFIISRVLMVTLSTA